MGAVLTTLPALSSLDLIITIRGRQYYYLHFIDLQSWQVGETCPTFTQLPRDTIGSEDLVFYFQNDFFFFLPEKFGIMKIVLKLTKCLLHKPLSSGLDALSPRGSVLSHHTHPQHLEVLTLYYFLWQIIILYCLTEHYITLPDSGIYMQNSVNVSERSPLSFSIIYDKCILMIQHKWLMSRDDRIQCHSCLLGTEEKHMEPQEASVELLNIGTRWYLP